MAEGWPVRVRTGAGITLAVTALVLGVVTPAPASGKRLKKPTKPTAVAVVGSTPTSITVTARVQRAKQFRVYAAPTARAVNAHSYRKAPYRSKVSASRQVTVGLKYQTGPYFLRYTARNRVALKFAAIQTAYVTPPVPTALTAVSTAGGGLALTWRASKPAERVLVTAATDPAFTQGVRTYTVRGAADTFTPHGLDAGTTYWFRVRAANGPSQSAWSQPTSATAVAAGAQVSVASYNIQYAEASSGPKVGDQKPAPWSERGPLAAQLLWSARPDVVAVQEGNSRIGEKPRGGYRERQVDDFAAALNRLGADYRVADTENIAETATGPYLLYRTSVWRPVGKGARIALPNDRWAAYQVLEHQESGARVLVVSAHLLPGAKPGYDDKRKAQAATLTAKATQVAKEYGVPVVYAGDFNSHNGKKHAFDGPGLVMAANGVPDTKDVSPVLVNDRYNSANQGFRIAASGGFNIDHIFAGPGLAVLRWAMLLDVNSSGRFVGTFPSDHNPLVADLTLPALP